MPQAFGFIDLADLAAERVTQIGVERVWDAVRESAAEHTRVTNALLASMVERTTAHQENIELMASGTLEPLDEHGNPLPRKVYGQYTVAYPLQRGGHAWGDDRESRALMTVEEMERQVLAGQMADLDWLRRHVLAAQFDNQSWTYADKQWGDLTIQPLANGDAVTYVKKGVSGPETDDHYYAQAGAISDNDNPFPTLYDELAEHPSNNVSVAFPVVTFIARNLRTAVKGLNGFDRLPSDFVIPGVMNDRAEPSIRTQLRFGDRVLGVVDDNIIVEWSALPENYMLSIATGAGPYIKMREQPAAALQGLFAEDFSPDGNHQEYRLIRIAGFGVSKRVAAVVSYIGGAAYVVPAAYDAPLAV